MNNTFTIEKINNYVVIKSDCGFKIVYDMSKSEIELAFIQYISDIFGSGKNVKFEE